MKKIFLALLLCVVSVGVSSTFAHQPRITWDQKGPFEVTHPEISQAFYGELRGQEDVYEIRSDTGFLLYANIVVPANSGARKDFVVTILQGDSLLSRLNGATHRRTDFYEPFAGDAYYSGPSFEKQVAAGTYYIKVANPAYQGKYSLAIGKIESFPGAEIVHTFKVLPQLKRYFFGKPVLSMFWNYIGAGLGIMIVILILLIWMGYVIAKKLRKNSKIAIDIVLLPPEEIMDKAIEMNKKVVDDPIFLDKKNCIPHISLCMGVVEEENLLAIQKIIKEIGSQFTALPLIIHKIHETQAGFDITKTDELQKLHETVMNRLSPYLSYDATPDMFLPASPADEKTIGWINKYRASGSFEHFFPHITLGIGKLKSDEIKLSFTTSKLAICRLGNYCTCCKVLQVVELK